MPPILHPRSRSTSSLFAATMVVSFVVVGLPHIFPCPAPRRTLADSQAVPTTDGLQTKRSRGKRQNSDHIIQLSEDPATVNGASQHVADSSSVDEVSTFLRTEAEAQSLARIGHECPVPKPRGIVGQLLGFSNANPSTKEIQEESSQR